MCSFGQTQRNNKVKFGLELTYSSNPKPTLKQIDGSMFLPLKSGLGASFGGIGLKEINKYSSIQFGLNSSFHFDYRVKGKRIYSDEDLLLEQDFHFIEFNGVKINLPINYLLAILHSNQKNTILYGKIGITTSLNFSNTSGELITSYSFKNNHNYENIAFYFHGYETEQLFEFYPNIGLQLIFQNKILISIDATYNNYTRVGSYTILRSTNTNKFIDQSTIDFKTKPYYLSLKCGFLF